MPSRGARRREHQEAQRDIARERYRLFRWLTVALGVPLSIASLYFPFKALEVGLQLLAGETTEVLLDLRLGITLVVTVGLGGTGLVAKLIAQRRELVRLRRRVGELEQEVARLKGIDLEGQR